MLPTPLHSHETAQLCVIIAEFTPGGSWTMPGIASVAALRQPGRASASATSAHATSAFFQPFT
jgi:hypothetical protein